MKLSMETQYIPYSSIYDRIDMMNDWRATSRNLQKYTNILGAFLIVGLFFSLSFDGLVYKTELLKTLAVALYYLLSALVLFLASYLLKYWKIGAYWLCLMSPGICALRLLPLKLDIADKVMYNSYMVLIIATALFSFVPFFYAFRCIYNYKSVFLELKKCQGFPDFIANTSDIYGKNMYISEKKSPEQQGKLYKKSGGYLNIDENGNKEIIDDSYSIIKERLKEEEANKEKAKPIKEEERKYKHGFSIGRIDILYKFDDIKSQTMDENRDLKYLWDSNGESIVNNFHIRLFLMLAGIFFFVIGRVSWVLFYGYAAVILIVLGISRMRFNAKSGGIVVTLGYLMFALLPFIAPGDIPATICLITSIYNLPFLFYSVRYTLNYKRVYMALSECEGFPSFIRNTAARYGDKLYIVEKQPSLKKRVIRDEDKIHMDIGCEKVNLNPETPLFEAEKEESKNKDFDLFGYIDEDKKENK